METESLKSPLGVAEEFYDAEENMDETKEDEDLMKKIELATSGLPPPKRHCPDKADTDCNVSFENDKIKSDSTTNDNELSLDEKKLEDDLLKDLDDDQDDDLEKEVEDLLESVLKGDEIKSISEHPKRLENCEKGETFLDDRTSELVEEKQRDLNNSSTPKEDVINKTNQIQNAQILLEDSKQVETSQTKTNEETVIHSDNDANKLSEAQNEICEEKDADIRADDLLIACEFPRQTIEENQDQQDEESESSSNLGDTPEDSSDGEKSECNKNGIYKQLEKPPQESVDDAAMQVDETTTEQSVSKVFETQEREQSVAREPLILITSADSGKEYVPFKLTFLRKFSSTFGKLSRSDLEELLIEKITESLIFCSDNTDLRSRLEKQEKLSDSLKKSLENVKKQYNDLEMIHNRVMKDLKDRPDAPITPVKITRAVGLQVYQPITRSKSQTAQPSLQIQTKQAKRQIDTDRNVNGNTSFLESAKRKKTQKITPMRPPLSEKERASLELQEAKEEQKLRTNVSKTVIGSNNSSTPNVTMTPVNTVNVVLNADTSKELSIDLTDDLEENNSVSCAKATPQPPALVAIRGNNQATLPQRITALVTKQSVSGNNGRAPQIRTNPEINRVVATNRHPAPLPHLPAQISKQGMKKIPPKPTIKINNVPNGIIVSWTVDSLSSEHAEIHSYQIYAYEETSSAPSTENWRHVGDVKALLLPMAVTLTQFQEGQKYYFAVRAMDVHKRLGNFSAPRTWADK